MLNLKANWSDLVSKAGIIAREYGPVAAIVGGVGLLIGGAVLAAIRSADVKEEYAEDVAVIKEAREAGESEQETKAIRKLGIDMAKRYAPVVALEVTGAVLVFGGYKKLSGRITALGGLLMASQSDNKRMLKYVEERWGPEAATDVKEGRDWIVAEGPVDPVSGVKAPDLVGSPSDAAKKDYSHLAFIYDGKTVGDNAYQEDVYGDYKKIQNAVRTARTIVARRHYIFLFELKDLMGIRPECWTDYDKEALWTGDPSSVKLNIVDGDKSIDVVDSQFSDLTTSNPIFMLEPDGIEYVPAKEIMAIKKKMRS